MFSLLRYSSHLSPINSLSVSRHSIPDDPNSLIKPSIRFIRSCIEEFPKVGIRCKRTVKATPLYTIASVRMLMFFVPNFHFVLSRTNLYGGSCGKRANINLKIRSESREYSNINLCILHRDDSVFTSESSPQAILSKQVAEELYQHF